MKSTAMEKQELLNKLEEVSNINFALKEAQRMAHIGSWVWDIETGKEIWSDEQFKIFGYEPNEVEASYDLFLNALHHENKEEVLLRIQQALQGTKEFNIEYKIITKNGTIKDIHACGIVYRNESNLPVKMIGTVQDISFRKIIENKNKQLLDKLANHNVQLEDFCNIISHNLRAPLTNIEILVDYIQVSNDDSEKNEMFSKIKPIITHLNEVFNELIESLQIKQDTSIECENINLEKSLNHILIGFESQIRTYGAQVQIDFSEVNEISFVPKYLDSLFANLISNALKYKSLQAKPIIKIKTFKDNKSTILSIADNGLGIDLIKNKNKIFKIRKTFHEHPEAKGFGLFLVKTQVESMGGRIWVESIPNEGSTFYVEFKS